MSTVEAASAVSYSDFSINTLLSQIRPFSACKKIDALHCVLHGGPHFMLEEICWSKLKFSTHLLNTQYS
jgi:hypothetical protein